MILLGSLLHGGFFWGQAWCRFDCLVVLLSCCASVLTMVAMALERYLSICWSKVFSFKAIVAFIGAVWFFDLILVIPMIISDKAGEYIALEDKGWFCIPNWSAHISPLNEITQIIFVLMSFNCIAIGVSYFQVYYRVQNAIKNSRREDMEAHRMQHMIFVRSLALTGVFVCFWGPEFASIAVEYQTAKPMSMAASLITTILVLFHSMLNPIMIVSLDRAMKKRVKEYMLSNKILHTFVTSKSLKSSLKSNPQSGELNPAIRQRWWLLIKIRPNQSRLPIVIRQLWLKQSSILLNRVLNSSTTYKRKFIHFNIFPK